MYLKLLLYLLVGDLIFPEVGPERAGLSHSDKLGPVSVQHSLVVGTKKDNFLLGFISWVPGRQSCLRRHHGVVILKRDKEKKHCLICIIPLFVCKCRGKVYTFLYSVRKKISAKW